MDAIRIATISFILTSLLANVGVAQGSTDPFDVAPSIIGTWECGTKNGAPFEWRFTKAGDQYMRIGTASEVKLGRYQFTNRYHFNDTLLTTNFGYGHVKTLHLKWTPDENNGYFQTNTGEGCTRSYDPIHAAQY